MTDTSHNLTYNSKKSDLIMPEYGRHIQEMINYGKTIEKDEERQHFIERVVDLMVQITPQNRNLDDVRARMWLHVFRIAEYDINVMPPNGEIPTPETARKKPSHIGYPVVQKKFRHYGHNVQELVKKALSMEDGELKDAFVEVIGSYMKLAYRTWNKEHYVSDDIIIEDLEALSEGKLKFKDDVKLDTLARANARKRSSRSNGKGKGRDDRGRGRKNDNRGGGRGRNNNNNGRKNYRRK